MKQAIFYSLTEAELFDHALIAQGLDDIASRGFDGVYLEYRNVRSGLTTPRFRKAVRAFCRLARERRLEVVVEACYKRILDPIKQESPEVFTDAFVPYRLPLRNGRFVLAVADEVLHVALERCWIIEAAGKQAARLREVTKQVRYEGAVTDGGGCAMTEWKGVAEAKMVYRVEGARSGEVFLVLRRRFEYSSVDLGHRVLRRHIQRHLELYRGLPVRGFAWDEPQFGFAFMRQDGRALSEGLFNRFRKRFGYDLRERLADLWWDQPGGRAALTRLHYAELMEQSLAELERDFARRARRLVSGGKDMFLGIHRTMHEETGDDFLIGCCDYFRHNRYTSGGFTDSIFGREDSMVTMLQLARSMAAANGGPAWNNSWGFVPQETHHAYYLRLMGAMHVRWIGHTYRSSIKFGPGYPHHPLWNTLGQHLDAHRGLLAALVGAQPAADTAVVYNWRAMGTFAGNYMHVHRRNLLLLGKALTYAQAPFEFIDTEALQKRTAWRRMIVPWPDLLPAGTLSRLGKLARAGVDVVIFGPPAVMDADGRSVAGAFGRLCGIQPVEARAEVALSEGATLRWRGKAWRLDPIVIEPHYRSNERASYPDRFKAYTLAPGKRTEVVATVRGKPVGVRQSGVTYVAAELPHFAGLIETLAADAPVAEGADGWVLFEYRRGQALLLSGVSRDGRPHDGALKWRGHAIRLSGCRSFVVAEHNTALSVKWSEGAVEFQYRKVGARERNVR